ncbi:MAG: winged helix-turn-helix domain-containing protein [Acidobacteriia bacterium]|nr:winged helix-turn-helix domain-containing protein [Terriglobia bacterium]
MYEFGRFHFDPADHLLLSGATPISLTPKAFDILVVLVQNGNRLTTKEELMSKVWPDSFVEEANLTINISALRKVLGETPDGQHYIETVPKKGYRFVVPITEVRDKSLQIPRPPVALRSDIAAPPIAAQSENLPPSNRTPSGRIDREGFWSRSSVLTLALVLVVLFGLSYMIYRGRSTRLQPAAHPRSLAVLPFQNLRESPDDDFLGFSLANAVITKLDYVSELAVRPSYAVQKYNSQTIDIPKVAADLNVDTLLTGTFLREGDALRITSQLIDVKTQNLIWKGTFDLKYEKLLSVQDSVAQQIIKGLELTLSPSEVERLKPDPAVNPLAYEYYLRGIDLYSKNDFPVAINMLEKSAELSPDYALTWANLGRAYTANASFQFGGGEQYRKAQAAFEHALSLQPDLIDARIYMANMFTDTGRVEKSVPLLREALRTNPNHAEIHWELGYAYRFAGMLQQSVSESERARQLDPGVKLNSSTLNSYLYLGQYDKFLGSLPATDDSALIVFYRGFGEYYKKNFAQAAKDFDHTFELDRSLLHAQIGKAISFGIHHQDSEAAEMLRSVESKINERRVGDPEAIYKVAQAYAMLGDKPSALRVLKQSIENGFFPYPYFAADPLLDPLRNENEFSELMSVARRRHDAFKATFF